MSNWPEVALGDVCEVVMGQAPPGSSYNETGDGWPLISGAGDFGTNYPTPKKFTTQLTRASVTGDLILGIRASIGAKVLADREYCLGRGVAALRVKESIAGRYLWHHITSSTKELLSKARGATFKQVNRKDIAGLRITLPPLEEQRRIAAILDKADELRTKRQEAIAKLDTLAQSIFIDMFGDPVTNPMGWDIQRLGEICDVRDGTHDSPKYIAEGGYPFLTTKNIQNGRLDLSAPNLITESDYEKFNRRSKVDKGDIIMPMIGTIGRPLLIDFEPRFAFKNMALIKFIPGSPLAEYIQTLLSGTFMKNLVQRQARGGTQAFVSLTILRNMQIPVPVTTEQKLFRDKLAALDRKMQANKSHQTELNSLFASLQQRAFKGEL